MQNIICEHSVGPVGYWLLERRIVEKPYYVIFASCWVCALMQQLIDTSRYYEERTEELSRTTLGSAWVLHLAL